MSGTIKHYFYVEDISGAANTLSIVKNDDEAPSVEVFFSTDGTVWTSMGTTGTTAVTAVIPANGRLYLKATADGWATPYYASNTITAGGRHNIGGNIMSLLYGDDFADKTTIHRLSSLFRGNTNLVSAGDLKLLATTLEDYCYYKMFYGCTSLTTAPALPATTLASACYGYMFYGCTSLTTAPALPATALADYCYSWMFRGCDMLDKVITCAQDIAARGCLDNWLGGVASTGELYNLGGATYTADIASGIPSGWVEHTSL